MRAIRVNPVRRLSRLLLGVVVSITLVNTGASARAMEASGFTYVVSSGSATVTGCVGTCPTTLVIPATLGGYAVTSIGGSAFTDNSLISVTIPDSVTSIGPYAFYDNWFANVTIPDSVTSIGPYAFANGFLSSITMPNSITSIGDRTFERNLLTSVTIPASVTSIGSYAFAYNWLTSVTIPNSVTSIGIGAFVSNTLTSVTIPNSVTSIGESAFAFNWIKSVIIPPSVTSISTGAFNHNWITSVTIPNTVTSIGSSAFRSNELTSVTVPASVMIIEPNAFHDNQLTRVTFMGNAPEGTGSAVFDVNPGLTSVARFAAAIGWGATWSGKRVVIATRATATIKPAIIGTASVSKTVAAKIGTWRGTPVPTYRFQWYACTRSITTARSTVPSTCTAIAGATRSTFKLTSAQRNKYVAVLVTGTSLGTTATTWLSKTTSKIR